VVRLGITKLSPALSKPSPQQKRLYRKARQHGDPPAAPPSNAALLLLLAAASVNALLFNNGKNLLICSEYSKCAAFPKLHSSAQTYLLLAAATSSSAFAKSSIMPN
jgi:hypothetical protein